MPDPSIVFDVEQVSENNVNIIVTQDEDDPWAISINSIDGTISVEMDGGDSGDEA